MARADKNEKKVIRLAKFERGGSSVVRLKNVMIKYGANVIIDNANLEISEGDFCCIVGANGAGKSTLVRGVLGLVKLSAGEVFCDTSRVGYLPQEAKIDAYFPATVMEIVLSGNLGQMGRRAFYGEVEKARAKESLERLGILDLAESRFGDLSGGQKQKVLLARALVAAQDILILDEPSNNLDHTSRAEFYQTLKDLNSGKSGQKTNDKKNGEKASTKKMTVIMVTHDLDADDLIGNKVVAIKQGQVEVHSTKDFVRSFK